MATNYEDIYRAQRHALGEPTKEIIAFFEHTSGSLRVLDVGCGQGRNALHLGRMGHDVVGIDLSKSGISQLNEEAKKEGLSVIGVVADILEYEPAGLFDVLLFDRTLHMLPACQQIEALQRLTTLVTQGGYVLINDQRKNLPAMERLLTDGNAAWSVIKRTRGFLFLQRIS